MDGCLRGGARAAGLAAVAAGGDAVLALERLGEGELGAVAGTGGDGRQRRVALLEQAAGRGHPPAREVAQRRFADDGGATRPAPGTSLPASVTGATESLTRALALELAPVRVNAVRPGPVRSAMWTNTVPDPQAVYDDFAGRSPLARVAKPEEIALAYLFLMSSPATTRVDPHQRRRHRAGVSGAVAWSQRTVRDKRS